MDKICLFSNNCYHSSSKFYKIVSRTTRQSGPFQIPITFHPSSQTQIRSSIHKPQRLMYIRTRGSIEHKRTKINCFPDPGPLYQIYFQSHAFTSIPPYRFEPIHTLQPPAQHNLLPTNFSKIKNVRKLKERHEIGIPELANTLYIQQQNMLVPKMQRTIFNKTYDGLEY